ncbi:MAG: hypothetical protein HY381_01590 [Candidatus Chisholmbacteria bacterium]|nr:hypothetical protein [Candidatus Chisholmbacteria bacterium]
MGELILMLVPKRPKLPRAVLERLSAIVADTAQVALASVVVPALFDRGDVSLILLGGVTTIMLWLISLLVAQQVS